MTSLLDVALSEVPGDAAGWPAALGAMRERDACDVLAVLFEAWVSGQLDAHLRAGGGTDRSFGVLLAKLPSRLTEHLYLERSVNTEAEVRRWCWAPGWSLLSQDEDLMVMRDEYLHALLEEGAAGRTGTTWAEEIGRRHS